MRIHRGVALLVIGVLGAAAGCAGQGGVDTSDPAWDEARSKGLVPLERVPPEYPRRAALAGVQGCATIAFDVLTDGRTDNFQVLDSKPPGVFARAAMLALHDWRFPERDSPIRTSQRIQFSLRGQPEYDEPVCLSGDEIPEEYLQPGEEGPVTPPPRIEVEK